MRFDLKESSYTQIYILLGGNDLYNISIRQTIQLDSQLPGVSLYNIVKDYMGYEFKLANITGRVQQMINILKFIKKDKIYNTYR